MPIDFKRDGKTIWLKCSIRDLEFIYHSIPPSDGFAKDLWDIIEEVLIVEEGADA